MYYFLLFIFFIIIDQASKLLIYSTPSLHFNILDLIGLTTFRNYNFLFSLPINRFYFYTCSIILLSSLIYLAYKEPNKLGYIFILSGSISNLVERLIKGYVVDIFIVPFNGVWNLSDFFIIIGIILVFNNEQSIKNIFSIKKWLSR